MVFVLQKTCLAGSTYHLQGYFDKKILTNSTGLENVSEKRNGLEMYHL